ncbi:hypothetical protein J2741_001743 [Methanolinea mesophila]|uniref:HNH endonuclease n=1 Tax=Methanolinea mesophila TaxID=547055 RepID=UPI001AE40C81|nr:HNH endonuclease signature motif containing protein [Methanolinea mesophila]MBP1929196.1 hypothetical protein [Methanolinea mesophila]
MIPGNPRFWESWSNRDRWIAKWWDELIRPGVRPGSCAWRFVSVLVAERYRWHCAICGIPCELEVHHKVPLCFGGNSEPSNLILLCRECHDREHMNKRAERMQFDSCQVKLFVDGDPGGQGQGCPDVTGKNSGDLSARAGEGREGA